MTTRKPASPTTIHRRAQQAPTLRDVQRAQRAATRARADAAEEQRRAAAEARAEQVAAAAEKARQQVRDVVMLRAGALGLDAVTTRRLAGAIETQRERAARAGQPFDVYRAMRDKLASLGRGVRVDDGRTPLDAQHMPPPPEPQAGALPAPETSTEHRRAAAERDERRQRIEARLRAEQHRSREQYEQRLRSMGLDVPSHGFSGALGTYTGR